MYLSKKSNYIVNHNGRHSNPVKVLSKLIFCLHRHTFSSIYFMNITIASIGLNLRNLKITNLKFVLFPALFRFEQQQIKRFILNFHFQFWNSYTLTDNIRYIIYLTVAANCTHEYPMIIDLLESGLSNLCGHVLESY